MIGYSNEHLEEQVMLLYTAGHLGGTVSPQVGPGQSPGGDRGWFPWEFFLLIPKQWKEIRACKKWDFSLILRYECNIHV